MERSPCIFHELHGVAASIDPVRACRPKNVVSELEFIRNQIDGQRAASSDSRDAAARSDGTILAKNSLARSGGSIELIARIGEVEELKRVCSWRQPRSHRNTACQCTTRGNRRSERADECDSVTDDRASVNIRVLECPRKANVCQCD